MEGSQPCEGITLYSLVKNLSLSVCNFYPEHKTLNVGATSVLQNPLKNEVQALLKTTHFSYGREQLTLPYCIPTSPSRNLGGGFQGFANENSRTSSVRPQPCDSQTLASTSIITQKAWFQTRVSDSVGVGWVGEFASLRSFQVMLTLQVPRSHSEKHCISSFGSNHIFMYNCCLPPEPFHMKDVYKLEDRFL